ncbi:MAG: acetylxylan esterase [Rubripirellula sp.]|nr:acetylxylan esterase [Rubripirellula sp.]
MTEFTGTLAGKELGGRHLLRLDFHLSRIPRIKVEGKALINGRLGIKTTPTAGAILMQPSGILNFLFAFRSKHRFTASPATKSKQKSPSQTMLLQFGSLLGCLTYLCVPTNGQSTNHPSPQETLDRYFQNQTQIITDRCLEEIHTLDDWEKEKKQRRSELLEMLGLNPLPERTQLNAVVTGGAEAEGVIVENLYFESSPGLYVTGNLYRPKNQSDPLPAILYVCGHGRVKKDGVSYGNKTHYQHHGAWFARNGYVCLTIDTIQLGELEGIHHGTYREKMWWWNNRGYTPAGVEAWNCMRAIDYLESRPEVDSKRIGVTGRSGGGAYSWWIAAIDERIKAAVPVAGITSMQNHVVDGCIEGHCDCMFMVNTYRWDYPMIAALVAPRALLISNTDKDRIFPLDGVVDVHRKTRKIYDLYNASENLGLHITEGPHQDTQELRIHAFRWLNRHLRNTDELISIPATKLFTPEQLRVFEQLPMEQRVTTIHETFVPISENQNLPATPEELASQSAVWKQELMAKTFAGWNHQPSSTLLGPAHTYQMNHLKIEAFRYQSDDPFQLILYRISKPSSPATDQTKIYVLNQSDWESFSSILQPSDALGENQSQSDVERISKLYKDLENNHVIMLLPRGVGPTDWQAEEKKQTQIRRRFMQLGQTLAGMRVYDTIAGIRTIRSFANFNAQHSSIHASGQAATWALFASVFESGFAQISLGDLPISHRHSPDLLNVSKVASLQQIALLSAASNNHLEIAPRDQDEYQSWKAAISKSELASELISLTAPK